jgi:hypothetical protein
MTVAVRARFMWFGFGLHFRCLSYPALPPELAQLIDDPASIVSSWAELKHNGDHGLGRPVIDGGEG